jgi:hypothetical protein
MENSVIGVALIGGINGWNRLTRWDLVLTERKGLPEK